jgi:hypothetical protein
MVLLAIKLLVALFMIIWGASLLTRVAMRIGGGREKLFSEDRSGWRTYVTFKPLAHFEERSLRPTAPFDNAVMFELCERLRVMGVRLDRVSSVGYAQRVILEHDGQKWELTAAPFSRHPTEQWLLTIDQRFKHGTSAPHDTSKSRAMLDMIRHALEGMEVSTIRWHARQRWNAGQVDAWAYKPY